MEFGELFLDNPDLFPARAGGTVWGEEALAIDFAGGTYRFTGLSRGQGEVARERFSDLVGQGDRSATFSIEVRVFRAAESDFRPIDFDGWSYSLDSAHSQKAIRVAGLRFMGRLEWRPRLGASLWTSVGEGRDFEGVFENFFRLLTAYSLLERGGILLHSAAVIDENEAFLFFGPSGAGKSTLARLGQAAGRAVLSDDLNVLWKPKRDPLVVQVPFAGDLGRTAVRGGPFRARAALRLEKGTENGCLRLSRAEALASLLASAPYLNSDPHRSDELEDNLQGLLGRLPTGRLTFAKHSRFEDMVRMVRETL